jgi:uncharacterized protein YndB with AHSA1/START domain
MSTDRIEKKILIKAPRSRVWRAISDSREFGHWFGVHFADPFKPNTSAKGALVGTAVDPEIAKAQQKHAGLAFEFVIDRIEPERLFSFRWHPNAVERGRDYSAEPMTLVEFTLESQGNDTLLTVTESGFDQIPLPRREQAYKANDGGWAAVIGLVEKYLRHES